MPLRQTRAVGWRKRVGVEPTSPGVSRDSDGFEVREGHRTPFASGRDYGLNPAGSPGLVDSGMPHGGRLRAALLVGAALHASRDIVRHWRSVTRSSRLFVSILLVLSFEAATALAQCPAGRWESLAPMIEPRQELAAAELGGVIFTVGGLVGSATANEVYDPFNDSWSIEADFPVATDHSWAVALGSRLYVGGGSSNRVFSYDPAFDRWNEVASSAFVHGGTPAAAVLNGRILVAGGSGGGMVGNEVEAYDPVTDGWSPLAPMSCARNHTAGGVIGGQLYVAGGRPGNQTCLEGYDPAADTWSLKAPMPTGRSGIAGAVVAGCFYVFGGEGNPNDPNGIFHEVEAYDPASDEWTPLPPMQTGRHGIYAAALGNVVYLPGGATRAGLGATAVNEAYVFDPPVAPRQPVILPGSRATPRSVSRE